MNVQSISFLISCFFVTMLSLILSSVVDFGIYFLYFLCVIFPLLFLQLICDGTKFCSRKRQFKFYVCVSGFAAIGLPLFFGFYFAVLYPNHSMNYEKVENCQVIGMATMAQPAFEVYSVLYVNFEYNNQQLLGYGCMSDQVSNLAKYTYTYLGDAIVCDTVGPSYDTPYNNSNNSNRIRRLYSVNQQVEDPSDVSTFQKQKNRMLRQRGVCDYHRQSYYNFSKVKLPSWTCVHRNSETFSNLTELRTCYVNFISLKQKSLQNAIDRLNQREVQEFAQVQLIVPPHLPGGGVIALLIFTFLPMNVMVYPIMRFLIELSLAQHIKYKDKFQTKQKFYNNL